MKIYIDGKYYERDNAKVSVFDHGLLYGDGVFEGIRAYHGRVFHLRDHVDRLYASAKAIYLKVPMPPEEMSRAVCETVRKNRLKDAYIRVLVTRGTGELGMDMRKCPKATVIIIAGKIALYPEEVYRRGLRIATSHLRKACPDTLSPAVKSLNYLNNVLARAEAARAGCDEALMLDRDGRVAECSGDNIFLIRDREVSTPPVHAGILEGVTRKIAMTLARRGMGLEVVERPLTLADLCRADEVFATGTGAEIIGVVSVDGHEIADGKPGPLTQELIRSFREYARSPAAGTAV